MQNYKTLESKGGMSCLLYGRLGLRVELVARMQKTKRKEARMPPASLQRIRIIHRYLYICFVPSYKASEAGTFFFSEGACASCLMSLYRHVGLNGIVDPPG